MSSVRWDAGAFGVERACTCRLGDRSAECSARGWHLVDSSNDRGAAIGEAGRLAREIGVPYRVVVQSTQEVV